jgi:hypothetical protein
MDSDTKVNQQPLSERGISFGLELTMVKVGQ